MAMRNFRYFVNEFCMSPNLFERFRMENMHIRQAQAAHHRAVVACVRAAYSKYLVRMDREPAPLHADYKALIAQGVVYVLVTNEVMTETLRFYQKLGFEEEGRRVEDGYHRVFLRKGLG